MKIGNRKTLEQFEVEARWLKDYTCSTKSTFTTFSIIFLFLQETTQRFGSTPRSDSEPPASVLSHERKSPAKN